MTAWHYAMKLTTVNSSTSQLSVTQNGVTPVTFMAQIISAKC